MKKDMLKVSVLVLAIVISILSSCEYENEEELFVQSNETNPDSCAIEDVSFQEHILPILQTHCLTCHDEESRFGNIVLEGISNVRIYANSGQLLGSITHSPGFSAMPDNGGKLPECDIETVRQWIENGTPQ